MVYCDHDDLGCYAHATKMIQLKYFAWSYYYTLVQGAIATTGVLLLFLWHRKRKVTSFVVAISILLVSSAITAYSFALSDGNYYKKWAGSPSPFTRP